MPIAVAVVGGKCDGAYVAIVCSIKLVQVDRSVGTVVIDGRLVKAGKSESANGEAESGGRRKRLTGGGVCVPGAK